MKRSSAPGGAAGTAPVRLGRSTGMGYALLLALLPLAQAVLDPRWLFDGPGTDPWIYYGYFRFTRLYLHEALASAYYASRLSVILPGFLARWALPALPANVVLHLALYGCAIGAFFYAARAYAGRRGALLAALVLGSQPFFLHAVGSNYVDGFGITYFLLTLAALAAAAARPAGGGLLALAGAGAVAIVSANLFYTVYLPLLAAHFLVLNRRGARRRLLPAAGWVAAGGAVAFLVFDAAGWLWGHGSRFFLAPTLRWFLYFARTPSIFKHPISQWGPTADWLISPLLVLAASAVSLAVMCRHAFAAPAARDLGPGRRWAAAFASRAGFAQLQYLAFFAVMAWVEAQPHGVTLEYRYYADLLLPPACLALAVQLAPLVEGLAPRAFGWLAAGAGALLALAGAGALPLGPVVSLAAAIDPRPLPIALPLVLGGFAVAAIGVRPRSSPAAIAAAAVVIVSLVASSLAGSAVGRLYRGDAKPSPYDDSVAVFTQIDHTLTVLSRHDPTLRLRLWFNGKDPAAGALYQSVACAWRLCDRLVTLSFPNLDGGRMCNYQPLRAGLKIAVLSEMPPPAAAAAASRALASLGLEARNLATATVPGPIRFTLLFLETGAAPPAVRPPATPS